MTRRFLLPLALALGIALLATACVPSCPQSGAEIRLYDEDFEALCDGAPCRWALTSSAEAGTTETVTTLHAGETGVRLTGNGVLIASDGAGNRGPNGSLSFPLVARVSARCDEGASLVLRFVTERPDDRERVAYSGTLAPSAAWGAPSTVTLTRDDRRGETFETLGRSVVFASIEKLGEGSCEVDRLELVDMSFSGGFCD